jgi:hypothetical protein
MADLSLDTLAIHAGEEPDPSTGALTPPIHMSATFRLPGFGSALFNALTMGSPDAPYAYVNEPLQRVADRPGTGHAPSTDGPPLGERIDHCPVSGGSSRRLASRLSWAGKSPPA